MLEMTTTKSKVTYTSDFFNVRKKKPYRVKTYINGKICREDVKDESLPEEKGGNLQCLHDKAISSRVT